MAKKKKRHCVCGTLVSGLGIDDIGDLGNPGVRARTRRRTRRRVMRVMGEPAGVGCKQIRSRGGTRTACYDARGRFRIVS